MQYKGRAIWLAIGTAIFVVAAATGVSRAALQSGEPGGQALSRFMPRSPVIERVQIMLREFQLYDGPADGRVNDELTIAVKQYQSISGLQPDGRINEELLGHIEFKGEAQRLLSRLEDVSKTQRAVARQKLQQSSLTRKLLDQGREKIIADPTRDATACYTAPTIACLIHEAVETAKSVHRRHFRDWVYGEIAIVQARARMPDAARQSAGYIEDPRLIIKTLRDIAEAQAETDQLDAAVVSAGIVPDQWSRIEALSALATAQARAGDWPSSRRIAEEISSTISEFDDARPKTALLGKLAGGLSAAGDEVTALSILAREGDRLGLSDGPGVSGRNHALSTLSAAYSNLDQPDNGRRHMPAPEYAVHRRTALIALALAEARGGRDNEASDVAAELKEDQYRAVALADIARIQMTASRSQAARLSLQAALQSAKGINADRKFAGALARDRISLAWLSGGHPAEAEKAAENIADAKLRAYAFARIGNHFMQNDDAINGGRLYLRMENAAASIGSALNRVWMYANVSLYLAEKGDPDHALKTFRTGLGVTQKMSSSWARAQALVRLVSALEGLTKTGLVPGAANKN